MFLPHCIPLASPHVAAWFGESGKQYNFAVARARAMWLGHPAVYVLVRHAGGSVEPLFVGWAGSSDPELGGAGAPDLGVWEQALALGMTHVHLRFEACSDAVRQAEMDDLERALRPPLNLQPARDAAVSEAAEPAPDERPYTGGSGMRAPGPSAWPSAIIAMRTGVLTRLAGLRRSLDQRLAAILAVVQARNSAPAEPAAAVPPAPPPAADLQRPAPVDPPAPPVAISTAHEPQPVDAATEQRERRDTTGRSTAPVDHDIRVAYGFGTDDLVILFAGELSHEAGADLAVQAMATVAHDRPPVRLVLVGEGPLRGELEHGAFTGGCGDACRFLGHLPAAAFADVLAGCDAVVIPARVAQDPALASAALAVGKPVLTTQQARLDEIVHGENGLVTYDNPGSLVWVLREAGPFIARRCAQTELAA